MEKFIEIFKELVVKRLQQTYQFTVEFGPKIILAVIILITGLICALLLKKIIAKILKATGFDVLAEKTGLKGFLEKGGIVKKSSSMIGLGFYWLIIFSTLIMVFNTLELPAASRLIQQTLLYIPKIIVAVILFALGIFLSRFVAQFVQTSTHLAKIPVYKMLGRIARYIVIGLTVMIALEYLGVATTIIVQYAIIIFIVVPSIIALILMVGARDIIASFFAGRMLLREYKQGDIIEFDSVSGEIGSIDYFATKIKSRGRELIIPNAELAKKIIKRNL